MNAKIYRSLYRIRRVEEEIGKVYPTDKIKSPVHLSIGQEAVSVGVCLALDSQDIVFGTYRGHALYLAKGGNLKKMIAELYGKATGCAKGKGGSMHLIDVAAGVMGESAIVGTTIPQAVGYAYALKIKRSSSVVVSFFGDGAVEEGVFHESMNFAALKKLPIIFICENNFYAIHTHQMKRQANPKIWERVKSYGISSERIVGNDLFKIYQHVGNAVKALRSGKLGPIFFECTTYRLKEHVGPNEDYYLGYRTREEAEPWLKNDPLQKLALLIKSKNRQEIEKEVEKEIVEAFAYAEKSPFPKGSELFTEVFKD
ncbi:MAG: thiamine pyrophosphate-dependent dehydrogenase E1 component subunit alpha [Candidatus Levyibacteriota bacterium]|nr:MAG: thiamine pyrophosphate-dependent dehydrogenase E1 component subunit alpha [Candidatus Levybacteria bacterium]